MIDIIERARRYVARMPAAVSGQGGHNATFAVAIALVRGFSLSVPDARPIIQEFNQRCEPEWSAPELEHKLTSALTHQIDKADGYLLGKDPEKQSLGHSTPQNVSTPAPKAKFENEKLKKLAAPWRDSVTTAWLADRSAIDPFGVTSAAFLGSLYKEGEYVIIFTNQSSQGQAIWPRDEIPAGAPEGVWYLAQPVDGKVYPNPRSLDDDGKPKPSRRSEESVKHFRFIVLESDEANARDWIGALVQMPLAIAAIYTSGKRSVHALVRVEAPSINEWRNFSNAIKPVLLTLGACQPTLASAVRLSRLPGCMRGKRLQKLLYLNPTPAAKPIIALPKIRDVVNHWTNCAFRLLPYDSGEIIARHLLAKGVRYEVETRTFRDVDLNDCIAALDEHANPDLPLSPLNEVLCALEWFSTTPDALAMLEKVRARLT